MSKLHGEQVQTIRVKVAKHYRHGQWLRASGSAGNGSAKTRLTKKELSALKSLSKTEQQAVFMALHFMGVADIAVRHGHNRNTFIAQCVRGAEVAAQYRPCRNNRLGLAAWRAVQALEL